MINTSDNNSTAYLMGMEKCFIKMETIIEVNGLMESDKEEEFRCIIRRQQSTKVSGKTTFPTDKES
jgi:hypothetical protein